MLIIAGTITVDPDHLDDALALAIPFSETVRSEPGCVDYLFTPNPAVPGELRLFEIWEDEAALAAHFDTPHMAVWQQQIGQLSVTGRDIAKYEISAREPL